MKMNNKKIIICYSLISIIVALLMISMTFINTYWLMGNSVYDSINIKEKEQYTLKDDYVSACESLNDGIVKTSLVRGKCILTGISKGNTDVTVFIASDGISSKTYSIKVNSSVKIYKKFRISNRTLIFNIDTVNINNIDFKYSFNNNSDQQNITANNNVIKTNNTIKFNNLNNSTKRVCLYAYDDNKLVDSLCINRGLFNLFW